ncbi:MAG: DUF3429 domain-containing protein [Gemmobacter sp.]
MRDIPRPALFLGLAGLVPFLWGAITMLHPPLGDWGRGALGPRFVGPYVGLFYGTVILSFMSGVLWGFATRLSGSAATLGYAASVVPALWAFFMVGGGPEGSALSLIAGFTLILGLDWAFWRAGLAPPWWLHLRVMLTAVVVPSLATVLI